MTRTQLRAAIIALAFCVNAILWQVSESATVVPPTAANPCATITCTSPRTCKVDQQSNQPMCVCPVACNRMYKPVCGSNGKTYSNECELKADACQSNTTITNIFNGSCDANPCATITCTSPRICQVDQQSNQPKCVCPAACPMIYQPVCGSNGKSYGNQCQLDYDACQSNTTITTIFNGNCEDRPTGAPSNQNGSVLTANPCSGVCNRMYQPVCGSNGKTYSNECELNREACQSNSTISLLFNGTCESNPCATITCTSPRICQVDQQSNQPKCVCRAFCTMIYQPVCGSNGKSYGNQCQLDYDACQSNTTITTIFNGNCEDRPTGAPSNQNGTVVTANPCSGVCNRMYQPVCGSNGKTYSNECELNREACQSNTTISPRFNGTCEANPCATITCTSPRICQVDPQSNQPKCVCSAVCPMIYQPVCGSNGKSYGNQCQLDVDACQSNTTITTVFNGNCEDRPTGAPSNQNGTVVTASPCSGVCNRMYQPVCGSNGKTYSNECELNREACQSNTTISPRFNGTCEANPCATITCTSPRICQVDPQSNQPKCVCSAVCPMIYQPVCGSNGKSYGNQCQLDVDACQSNTTITTVFNGNCEDRATGAPATQNGTVVTARNPCDAVRCREGYYCQVDQTNAARCVCTDICTADYTPVCGTDGKTYSNRCQLYSTSCKSGTNNAVAYEGDCVQVGTADQRCAAVSCSQGAKCQVNDQNETRCVCNEACTKILAQVCGSDGTTYGNQCELDKAACKSGTNISVVNQGECGKAGNPCDTVRCREGYYCQVDQTNAARCVCTDICTADYTPVCGTDGKTYSNRCQLYSASCKSGTNNAVAYEGECVPDRATGAPATQNGTDVTATNPCATVRCANGTRCTVDDKNTPQCTSCPAACPAVWIPVCGSDGKTYGNQCELSVNSCNSGTNISVVHEGACVQGTDQRCAAVSCTQGAKCQVNDQNETSCVCKEACTRILDQVCGSDGKTYGNQCELDKAACLSGTNISVVNQGECGKATNPCAAVLCPEGTRCQVNEVNEGQCVCNEICNDMYAPVCGSDGTTYSNQCELYTERCKHNQKLTVVCQGICQRSGKKLKCRSADI